MSKTIDVREGDRFERTQITVYQYRDGQCRGINKATVDEWWPDDDTDDEFEITARAAEKALVGWGYQITRDEGKVEGGDEAKPADVVDAVWVEDTMADGSKSLTAYSGRESAEACATLDMERGRARIVRIRPDAEAINAVFREMLENYSATDHNARAMADDAKVRAADAIQLANDARDRGRKANERLDALESRLAAVEKPTQTGVVKVPKFPQKASTIDYGSGWDDAIVSFKVSLDVAGVKWEEGK